MSLPTVKYEFCNYINICLPRGKTEDTPISFVAEGSRSRLWRDSFTLSRLGSACPVKCEAYFSGGHPRLSFT